jgi:hypothetical protein
MAVYTWSPNSALGSVAVTSLPPLVAGSAVIGAVTQSGTWNIGAITSALPAGANALGSVSVSALPALPAGANAIGSVSVSNFPGLQAVTGTFWQTTQPVSASALPLPSGAATSAKQPALGTAGLASADVLTIQGIATMTPLKVDGSAVTQPISIAAALPTGANVIGALSANQSVNAAQINGVAPLMGNGVTGTGSQRVTIASDNTAFSVNAALPTSATGTLSSVASSATSVTILALNASRKGMTVFNESTSILYLAFAATASLTAYTLQVPANSYYELPFVKTYTGIITGIWASANGNARVTELT